MRTNKIMFATGSRADYGIVRRYLSLLNEDRSIDLSIIVTGALLSPEYGHQVDLIYKDGFNIDAEIPIPIDTTTNYGTINTMSSALSGFGEFFESNKPNLLIILGDRYEMLSVAIAASMNRIPILHLHGGEATFGNYDEFIRHSITKMSLYHFTATEEYRNRVIQLGESPERVFNLGALGAENCLNITESEVPEEIKSLREKKYFVVLFHPETLTNISVENQIEELLNAISHFSDFHFVFLGSNSDTHSHIIRNRIKNYVSTNDNCSYYENIPTVGYHYLLKHSYGLIGNSSSGLIEAPSLGVFTINIGDRQEGRVRGHSVIDVRCVCDELVKAIESLARNNIREVKDNPYFKENTAQNYYFRTLEIIKLLENGANEHPKRFFDLPNDYLCK